MKYETLTFNKKMCIYFVNRIKSFQIKKGDMQCETHSRTSIGLCMAG